MGRGALREEFYAAVLPVVRSELPGIRADLHRKIATQIASKLSGRVFPVYEENEALKKAARDTAAAKAEAATQRKISEVIKSLQSIQEKHYGEA